MLEESNNRLITADTPVTGAALNAIAHIPTRDLLRVVEEGFFTKLRDEDFMSIAVWLAQKGYDEGGCPIGGVVIDNETRQIVGKGHNTLVQENHPYNHGETSAIRDAGRRDFSLTTIFTTLSPCDVCAALIHMRGFKRVVVGDTVNASGNEEMLGQKASRSIFCLIVMVLRCIRGIVKKNQLRTLKTGWVWLLCGIKRLRLKLRPSRPTALGW